MEGSELKRQQEVLWAHAHPCPEAVRAPVHGRPAFVQVQWSNTPGLSLTGAELGPSQGALEPSRWELTVASCPAAPVEGEPTSLSTGVDMAWESAPAGA